MNHRLIEMINLIQNLNSDIFLTDLSDYCHFQLETDGDEYTILFFGFGSKIILFESDGEPFEEDLENAWENNKIDYKGMVRETVFRKLKTYMDNFSTVVKMRG